MCSLAPVLQHLTLDTAMQGMLQGPAGSSTWISSSTATS